jgi:spermidine synthase
LTIIHRNDIVSWVGVFRASAGGTQQLMKQAKSGTAFIYIIFFLSGITGLIYETVWLRMLIRILGNTVYATSVILAAFMGGLAIGSFLFGKISGKSKNPLRLYAILESGIGVSATLFVGVLPLLTPFYKLIYSLASGQRFVLMLAQSLIMIILLLVPTSLMGGTLPVLSLFVNNIGDGDRLSRRIGLLYGANTLGACVGVIASGLYTIGEWGEHETVYSGVIINFLIAGLVLLVSKRPRAHGEMKGNHLPDVEPAVDRNHLPDTGIITDKKRLFILITYGISGFAAISYEIIWTRMFQIQLGTSIYAFSMMLGCYLLGIGLGSMAGGRFIRKGILNLRFFGWLQLFTALYGLAGTFILQCFSPADFSELLALAKIFIIPLIIVTPLTFALGLMFPALSAVFVDKSHAGRDVARLYSVNTVGCIVGSLVCGFLFIHLFGTRGTVVFVAGINSIIGVLILFNTNDKIKALAAGIVMTIILVIGYHAPDPFLMVLIKALKVKFGNLTKNVEIYYHRESTCATTTVFGIPGHQRSRHLYINGVGVTTLCTETKLMSHLPCMVHPSPRNILVVCLGMGTALRSAWSHGTIEVDVVELIPETYACFKYFHVNAGTILSDPRVRHYADDGRNFLNMRTRTYDVITLDPAPPLWSAGTVNLYTKEFFESCRSRLNPGGIMCLWIPPASFADVRMIMKTFHSVFPATSVWRGPHYAGFFMISSSETPEKALPLFQKALSDKKINADINEWEDPPLTAESLQRLYLLSPEMLELFTGKAPLITDNHPYTEFPLFRSLSDSTARYWLDANWLRQWKEHHFPK